MAGELDKVLELAKKRYKESTEYEQHNYSHFKEALKFVDLAEQWPEDIKAARESTKRPCLTINKTATYVRKIVNDQLRNSPSLKVFPADSLADPGTAKIINGLIRNIEQVSEAEKAYDMAISHTAKGGFGFLFVESDYLDAESFDQDILIRRVLHPQNCHMDPAAEDPTGMDGDYCMMAFVMPEAEFKEKYPDATDWDLSGSSGQNLDWYSSTGVTLCKYWEKVKEPCILLKLDSGEVLSAANDEEAKTIAEQVITKGMRVLKTRRTEKTKIIYRLLCGHAVLDETDWPGRRLPLVRVIGNEVYIDGVHYTWGLVRDAMDPARMYNYWRTATTEQVALATKAPWVGPAGFADGRTKSWQNANTENIAYLEYEGPVAPTRQPFAGTPMGALQETMSASEDIKAVSGIFDAAIGDRSNETSGVAINARKVEGDLSTYNYKDNLAKAIKQVGKIIIDLIPIIYDSQRVVRILNPDGEGELIPINHEFIDNKTGKFIRYDLSRGKYDFVVDTGPSFMTQRQEASEYMMEFIRAFPAAGGLVGDLIAKNQDWPGSEDFAERLRLMLPPQLQGENPELKQAQMQLMQMQQAIKTLQAELQNEKENKSIERQELGIKQFEAQTDRIEAISDIEGNQQEVQRIVVDTLQRLISGRM